MAALTPTQLSKYLDRINLKATSPRAASTLSLDLHTLCAVKWAHLKAIPFENLSLRLDVAKAYPPTAAVDACFEKLVDAGRGGYCYEQNAVFCAALRALGFSVIDGAARVVVAGPSLDPASPSPRALTMTPISHRLAFVPLDDKIYLVDVGFGGGGAPLPLALPQDPHTYCSGSTGEATASLLKNAQDWELQSLPLNRLQQYRLTPGLQGTAPEESSDASSLQYPHQQGYYLERYSKRKGVWRPIYFFRYEEAMPQDFEAYNFVASSRPTSQFLRDTMVAKDSDEGRMTVYNDTFKSFDSEGELVEQRIMAGEEELLQVLKEQFGIRIA